MTVQDESYAPIRVHLESSSVPMAAAADRAPRELVPRFYTVTLTTDEPVKQVLPPSPNREYALLISLDNDVVLADSKSNAQASGNVSDTSLARPTGAAIPTGVVIPMADQGEVWAGAASYPSRISVLVAFR